MRMQGRKLGTLFFCLFLLAVAATGCDSFLDVSRNPNQPDRERALANPSDVETLIGGSFFQLWSDWQLFNPQMGLINSASSWRSGSFLWGMDQLGKQPREAWPNSPSSRISSFLEAPWNGMYGAISSVNDGLIAIEQEGIEIGPEGERNPRARAFAKLVQGYAHANLAVMFDRAYVVTENSPAATNPAQAGQELELQPYAVVMDSAQAMLDEAIQIAENNSFTLEGGWINGHPMSSSEFVRFTKSLKARKMVQVARTPDERADVDNGGLVDWSGVIRLTEEGIESDFFVEGDGLGGNKWGMFNMKMLSQSDGWGRLDYHLVGPADNSGAFQDWLETPLAERADFVIETRDRRIRGADSLTAPGKYIYYLPSGGVGSDYSWLRYTTGELDIVSDDVGNYDGPNLQGPLAFMMKAEMDMLKAEGLLRTGGSKDEVARLINKTRVENGELPPASSANPTGSWEDEPSNGQPENGYEEVSLWAMMKYEKQIETFCTATALHYADDRGWQDLIENTPLQFPLPAQELNLLQKDIYTFGGGGEWSATAGWQ